MVEEDVREALAGHYYSSVVDPVDLLAVVAAVKCRYDTWDTFVDAAASSASIPDEICDHKATSSLSPFPPYR